MHILPADVRGMSPGETALLIEGWNEANSGDMPEAMSVERFEELKRQYPDE